MPADLYPTPCPACDGDGVIPFATTVYEPGCAFSHQSTDERPCDCCGGDGQVLVEYEAPDAG